MKILFERRTISYSISKEEVIRVLYSQEIDDIIEATFLVRILDGHPTILLEPTTLFPEISSAQITPWKRPTFIFILRRDGDAGRAIFVDSFDRRVIHD